MASRSGPPSEKVHKMQGRDHRPGRREGRGGAGSGRERASQGQGQWHPQGCPPAPRRRSSWSPGVAPRRPVCPASGLRAAALGGEGHHAESPPAVTAQSSTEPGSPRLPGPLGPLHRPWSGRERGAGTGSPRGERAPQRAGGQPSGAARPRTLCGLEAQRRPERPVLTETPSSWDTGSSTRECLPWREQARDPRRAHTGRVAGRRPQTPEPGPLADLSTGVPAPRGRATLGDLRLPAPLEAGTLLIG